MKNIFSCKCQKNRGHSIRYQTFLSFLIVVFGAVFISATVLISTRQFVSQYHKVAEQVTLANRIVPLVRDQIGTQAYYLVAGRETLADTTLFQDIAQVEDMLKTLGEGKNNADSRKELRIARRTRRTLEKYTTRLRREVENGESLVQQNETLDQIRSIAALMHDELSEYIYVQLGELERLDARIQTHVKVILAVDLGAFVFMLLLLCINQYRLERSINEPITALVDNIQRLGEGDFDAHVKWKEKNEITVLSDSFNAMVNKLQRLMEQVREDTHMREQLELRLMQEQINPHFLYNTLEIIIWLAEAGDKRQLVEVVKSLSRFFRTVLSGGRANITVRDELECIRSYLYIQQTRYIDILRYEIEAEKDVLDCTIQKLSLQPLVENALHHGIEKKRGGGVITIRIWREGRELVLSVEDTGGGIAAERLAEIHAAIESTTPLGKGFGLSNLQKRVRLRYGAQYGLTLCSTHGEGTKVTLRICAECTESENN